MAATPRFKVYSGAQEYVGAVKYAEDAAALASLHGPGSTVRDGHRKIVWTAEESGMVSYDEAAEAIYGLIR
jgi:hypothetical protein